MLIFKGHAESDIVQVGYVLRKHLCHMIIGSVNEWSRNFLMYWLVQTNFFVCLFF